MRNTIFLILLVLLISSCGTRKVERNAPGNTDQVSEVPLNVEDPNKPLLECIEMSAPFITAKVSTYYDNTLQLRVEAVRMQISDLQTDFDANRGHSLQFFRWKANSTDTVIDSKPVTMRFESRNLPGSPLTGNYTYINHARMIKLADETSLSGTTVQNVLSQLTIVLSGLSFEDDAIKAVIYDENGKAIEEVDALLPGIHINPSHYADDHGTTRNPVLMDLHPYRSTIGETRDAAFYENAAAQSKNCFFNTF